VVDNAVPDVGSVVRIGVDCCPDALARLEAGYRARGWPDEAPTYALASDGEVDESGRALETGFLLYQLAHMEMSLSLDMVPSSLPIVGRFIDAFKRQMHQLVLFYVNHVAANSATASMLQALLIRKLVSDSDASYDDGGASDREEGR
jgi:hypothetical protein